MPIALHHQQWECVVGTTDVLWPQNRAWSARTEEETSVADIKTKVRPLGDRIVVRRVEEEEVQRGGIIIPDTAKEKPQQGEVLAVGPGRVTEEGKRLPIEVKVGDRILMGKYAGTEVKLDGEECLILREDDVLAIIT
jgi:chaperonin GroES